MEELATIPLSALTSILIIYSLLIVFLLEFRILLTRISKILRTHLGGRIIVMFTSPLLFCGCDNSRPLYSA